MLPTIHALIDTTDRIARLPGLISVEASSQPSGYR